MLLESDFPVRLNSQVASMHGHNSVENSTLLQIMTQPSYQCLHKNINLPWLAATGLAVWFLFIHTPTFWIQRKLLTRDILAIHIVAASTIYLSCAHNCIFTPSFTAIGQNFKFMHVWVGRIGMAAGIVSFTLGAFLAWSRLGLDTIGGTTLAFAVPITIGGIAQVNAQYNGYFAIRHYKSLGTEIHVKTCQMEEMIISNQPTALLADELKKLKLLQRKALRKHIGNMISLFVSACGIPAGIRLGELVSGSKDGIATVAAILAVIAILYLIGSRYMNIMMPDMPSEWEGLTPTGKRSHGETNLLMHESETHH
jgi:hypothetical protein